MPNQFDPQRHHRRSIRLIGYDYTEPGAYFVTIVTYGRECLFGEIVNGEMQLNPTGQLIVKCWEAVTEHFPFPELDAHVLMPNHLHGILVLNRKRIDERRGEALTGAHATPEADGNFNASPLPARGTQTGSLNAILQNFKSVSTRKMNKARDATGNLLWQRNYFERIIRNERELENIRTYIENNPAQWAQDAENPQRRA